MKRGSNLAVEATLAAKRAAELGMTQSMIAEAVGASQSQVSRVFAGVGSRRSRLFDEICKYVFSSGAVRPSVSQSVELTSAIEDVWDGSAGHAKALALVIRSLGSLRCARPVDHSSQ
jgi:hypothetical protein